MSQILAMTRKEIILWAQKPGAWVIVFLVPILFIWIMQAIFGSSGTPVVTVYAVNEDESRESQQVMQALQSAENLRIELLDTRAEADRRVGAGERMAAVVVPEGFSSGLTSTYGAKIDIIIDPARAEQANIVVGLVNAALGPLIIDAEVTRGVEASVDQIFGGVIPVEQPSPTPVLETTTPSPAATATEAALAGLTATPQPTVLLTEPAGGSQPAGGSLPASDETLRTFFIAAMKGVISNQVQEAIAHPQVQVASGPVEGQEKTRGPSLLDFLVPGYSLMFMFFLVPQLAATVIEERQTGALRRLLSAPVPRSRILLGKMLPYTLIAVAQLSVVLVASRFIFGIDLGSTPFALAVTIVCSALAMAGLGIFIAAMARTEAQADGLAIVIVLAMAVISGAMFPNIAIPGLQMATPHYWAMQGFLNVIARGQGIDGVILPASILLTMAALFFTAGAIRFRFE